MRDPTVRDVQAAIMEIHAFSESEHCPEWARCLVKHIAMVLENILASREK